MIQTTFDRVERRTVAVEVRERLIEAIRNGELIAGTALPAERVLCEQFNVARTSVREAIQGLATAGCIERRGNRAFVVEIVPGLEKAFDSRKATVRNLFEVRRVIEPAMAGLVALRASEQVRREIADLASRPDRACFRNELVDEILGWQHNLSNVDADSHLAFANGNSVFTVQSVSMDRDAAVVGARAGIALGRQARVNLDYNGLLGSRDKSHGVGLTLDWAF